ncbi:alpha-glucan family phosphorylase [Actinomycetospora lutea]|uniref:alpha-glucan family phosphorylase n=1 Tax=Actinomycetospora lutea TaxID=663604 RepID=UPI002366EE1D|nr:alpha-glucan family phosphorylase [Actinomycetospora lutea]MDD7942121.1 alpha-glucan family phosphorylase [Actinomycetospora lutea]
MKALRRFSVRAQLPAALAPLQELATNLRWTWHGPTQDLFATVDETAWRSTGGDPVRLLGEVRPQRLAELAEDAAFVGRVQERAEDLRSYLAEPRWYQSRADGNPAAIGYFSMEFGVSEVLPNYSGGLGILAGDHLKAASDLGVPLVAVGLLYRSGYFRQSLSLDGWQQEHYPALDPQGLPLHLLTEASGATGDGPDASGAPVLVGVAMPGGRTLRARVWVASVGRVPLLLLDADIEDNDPDLRQVTDRLYGGDAEHRIRQEILVGIGGVRAVRAFCRSTGHPAPEVFHTNEGHAGFLGLERIRELVDDAGLDFDQALATVRAGTVFTTHTPVPAGIDRFPVGLVEHYFTADMLPGIEPARVLALGREGREGEHGADMFNMAHMGLRLAQRSNGVSQLHGEVSRGMFQSLWGGFDAPEVPIGSVTNGVHGPTWTAREIGGLTAGAEAAGSPELFGVSDSLLWEMRGTLRRRLVEEVRRRVRASWLQRGASAPELAWTERVFDPDVLTIGFARRVPTYKRLTLMLRDQERLRSILLDPERPVQLVIAGKSHPADEAGKGLIQEMVRFADDPAVRHRIAFLPDYDMSMARYLYWGCDVWLNNPLRPLEACGTSGMKSALNGGLNLSVRDGWWDELYDGRNGWAIPTADGVDDPERRDDIEANALYELLGTTVAPLFYDRGADGVPDRWTSLVRHTLATLSPKVQATRMVTDYVEQWYAPAARSAARVLENGFAGAKELATYRARLDAAWSSVAVAEVDASGGADTPVLGAPMTVRAEVVLGGLAPEEVLVQAVVGRADDADELSEPVVQEMTPIGPGHEGSHRFEVVVALPHAGVLGYTVRVLPRHDLLAAPAELGRIVLPA